MPRAPIGLPSAEDKAQARLRCSAITVSRETWERLDRFVELLAELATDRPIWSRPRRFRTIWTRHVADSLQLLVARAGRADAGSISGSGGGFPGLVIACALAESAGAEVHLVESTQKKAAFLRDAAAELCAARPLSMRSESRTLPRTATDAVRRRDRARAGAARQAARLRDSAVEKGCGRPVSEGTRCRG